MSEAIVYVDTSEVREGALEDLKMAIKELADFVDANEPQLLAYNIYLSDDGTKMTVMHIHPIPHRWSTTWRWPDPYFAGSWTSSRCHRSASTAGLATRF